VGEFIGLDCVRGNMSPPNLGDKVVTPGFRTNKVRGGMAVAWLCLGAGKLAAAASGRDPAIPSIFSPASTPADSIYHLSLFVLAICLAIFLVVFGLLVYAVVKFRQRPGDDGREPAQIYGSNQMELAWTVIPVVIVVVVFLATARVIHAVEDARFPSGTIEITAVGHQFWWEFQYPQQGFIAANELHVPVSDTKHPTPTHITLLSADTDHSFWVPKLAGKTDLIPNRTNSMWIEPHETGVYLGQCAQYCGTQHAKMLLRVIVQSREDFDRWVASQQRPAENDDSVARGRQIFDSTACVNCHTIAGTSSKGRFGPDLTHLMSRETIAAGAALNNRENLRLWVKNPDAIKPGCLMPAMQLDEKDLDAVTDYLQSLK
jgi:cytochrome c oxidase subunit II